MKELNTLKKIGTKLKKDLKKYGLDAVIIFHNRKTLRTTPLFLFHDDNNKSLTAISYGIFAVAVGMAVKDIIAGSESLDTEHYKEAIKKSKKKEVRYIG